MFFVINNVVSTFVCVCGLILEHQWSRNFNSSNLYEWLQYLEYERKVHGRFVFNMRSDIWSTKKVLKALKLQI